MKGFARLFVLVQSHPGNLIYRSRYLALLAELTDERLKSDKALELARAILEKDPKDAMRIAQMVFRFDWHRLDALEIIAASLEFMQQRAKAHSIRHEIDKLKEIIRTQEAKNLAQKDFGTAVKAEPVELPPVPSMPEPGESAPAIIKSSLDLEGATPAESIEGDVLKVYLAEGHLGEAKDLLEQAGPGEAAEEWWQKGAAEFHDEAPHLVIEFEKTDAKLQPTAALSEATMNFRELCDRGEWRRALFTLQSAPDEILQADSQDAYRRLQLVCQRLHLEAPVWSAAMTLEERAQSLRLRLWPLPSSL